MTASKNFPNLIDSWVEESQYLQVSNQKIFLRIYRRKETQMGIKNRSLFIVHGFGEQSDRFLHWPFYLHTSLDSIGIVDLPGHGKSEGPRGHIENFEQFSNAALAAFKEFEKNTTKLFGKSQLHWLGASMGGLITIRTLIKEQTLPLTSVIVTEPQLGIAVQVPPLKEKMASLLEPLIGRLPLKSEIILETLSHDSDVANRYANNPLNHSLITPRLYIKMKNEMENLEKDSIEFSYPFMMLVPLNDQVVSWKKSLAFFNRLKIKSGLKKSLSTFPNFYHEIFNEVGKERPFTALEDWLSTF